MPYRVDLHGARDDALDRLVELDALDVEISNDGTISALMPDNVTPARVAGTLGVNQVSVSPATARDAGSTWVLRPRPIRIGSLRIVPAGMEDPDALMLIDAAAFGTGLHPTTAMCLEALDELIQRSMPPAVLDIGTGSGVLALGALKLGVPRALAIDLDRAALDVAAENARINGLVERVQLVHGGPERVTGTWPLVAANILPAPLIDMAPTFVRRLGHRGVAILSGMPSSVEQEVERAYRHSGLTCVDHKARAGWVGLVMQATW